MEEEEELKKKKKKEMEKGLGREKQQLHSGPYFYEICEFRRFLFHGPSLRLLFSRASNFCCITPTSTYVG